MTINRDKISAKLEAHRESIKELRQLIDASPDREGDDDITYTLEELATAEKALDNAASFILGGA